MTPENSTVTDGETEGRTDAEIEASIEAKIEAAVAAAVAEGAIDETQPVGVIVGTDGSITVTNVDGTPKSGVPDPVEFPAMYADDSRESLTDSHYKDHLESHWGF